MGMSQVPMPGWIKGAVEINGFGGGSLEHP